MSVKIIYNSLKGLYQIIDDEGGIDIDSFISSKRSKINTVTKTSNFTFGDDGIIFVDCSNGAVTGTLSEIDQNSIYRAKKIDSTGNPFVLSGSSIDGQTKQVITDQYTSISVVASGSSWYII